MSLEDYGYDMYTSKSDKTQISPSKSYQNASNLSKTTKNENARKTNKQQQQQRYFWWYLTKARI